MRNLWYFGLEPLQERYTYQLSEQWIPETFKNSKINFIQVRGDNSTSKINVGSVLDAYGRGVYAMQQCQQFMSSILQGEVQNNDIVYLQDFWTPGFEAVFYMLDLYGIKIKLYSMLHAQSVDEYDFTYSMKNWMRHFELGLDSRHDGIFVGSTIHRDQLRQAGFKSKIHVVSLPIHLDLASKVLEDHLDKERIDVVAKESQIIYTSRLDKEKNPYFMIKTALAFLERNENFVWVITTSAEQFRSNVPGFISYMVEVAENNPRLILLKGLTKEQYYLEVSKSLVQFNSALQDYVSWTLLESTMLGCDICYPAFRSFPEIINADRMYKPFKVDSAIYALENIIKDLKTHSNISRTSDLGRQLESHIMLNDVEIEYNIWHEEELIKTMIKPC